MKDLRAAAALLKLKLVEIEAEADERIRERYFRAESRGRMADYD